MIGKKALWMLTVAITMVLGFTLIAGTQRGFAAGPGDQPPGGIEVKIDNFTFGPAALTRSLPGPPSPGRIAMMCLIPW